MTCHGITQGRGGWGKTNLSSFVFVCWKILIDGLVVGEISGRGTTVDIASRSVVPTHFALLLLRRFVG